MNELSPIEQRIVREKLVLWRKELNQFIEENGLEITKPEQYLLKAITNLFISLQKK